MKICVDTTILLDVLKDEFRSFQEKLYAAIERREALVVPAVVIAELMPQFNANFKELASFLDEHKISVEPLDVDSSVEGTRAWMKYLKRKTKAKCPQCGYKLNFKEHFLSDFYIGGFAKTRCNAILTRDRGVYTKYFPTLSGYENCLNKE